MKINPSVKVAIVALGAFAAAYGAYWAFGEVQLAGYEPEPIAPGQVNFVAFKTDTNLRIRVANRVAQLVEVSDTGDGMSSASEADVSDARRIPIREFLQSLQGDEKALGTFITVLNNLRNDEPLPVNAPVWSAEDIEKALNGDPALAQKLEQDIHIDLDGTPQDSVRMSAIQDGIIIEVPVPVKVQVGNELKTLVGIVQEPYRPRIAIELERSLGEDFEPSNTTIIGNYRRLVEPIVSGETPPENVRGALERIVGSERKSSLAAKPERLLQSAQVLVADELFEDANYVEYKDDRGQPTLDLNIRVDDDARKRLWKYSRNTQGFELLLVVDGIAVAAPRIETQLMGRDIKIKRLKDKPLVERTIEAIKSVAKGS